MTKFTLKTKAEVFLEPINDQRSLYIETSQLIYRAGNFNGFYKRGQIPKTMCTFTKEMFKEKSSFLK